MTVDRLNMTQPVLYSFRRCPYAIRARLAIKVSGVAVVLREVVLRDKPAALLAVSPKATVPVLQLPTAEVLEESLDIMRWALKQNDPQQWLPAEEALLDQREQREQQEQQERHWVALNDGPFKQLLDRYKYASRHPERPAHSDRDEAVQLMLAPLNAQLAHSQFLLRDSVTLADMALLPFVRQFVACDEAWFATRPLPHLQRWLLQLSTTQLFDSVMPKFKPWRSGDADVLF